MTRRPHTTAETMKVRETAMPEFSRVFPIDQDMAPGGGGEVTKIEIETDANERKALASRFGLIALNRLLAIGTLEVFEHGCGARLDVEVKADVVQACVVTLEPVASHIEEKLVARFEPSGEAEGRPVAGVEVLVAIGEEENTEPLPENGIDVGDAVAQCLGLALDPYPRSKEADSVLAAIKGEAEEVDRKSSFAALEELKRK